MILETPWINLTYVLLSEGSQTEEAMYCMIPLVSHSGKSIGMENRSVVARVMGKGQWLNKMGAQGNS